MFESISIETLWRITAFVVIALLMIGWEFIAPKRSDPNRMLRWPGNLGIFILNVLVLTLLPLTAISAAIFSIEYKFGIFFWIELAFWPKVIISLLILDLSIYWQHRVFHLFEPLWKIHRMHHTDTQFDMTTSLRFHPIEIVLSILIKAVIIVVMGAPVFAVVLFEMILNGSAMFNHGNVKIPSSLDKLLRLLVVTPDMHRIHHSTEASEHNTNFGFALSLWDRLFNSYTQDIPRDQKTMTIGLSVFRESEDARLGRLMVQPFR